jgi:integrase
MIYLPWVQKEKRPATYNGYYRIWHGHLKQQIGTRRRLNDYEPFYATEFLTALAAKLGKNALSHVRAVMSSLFAHAVATGHLTMNPVHGAKILAAPKPSKPTDHYTIEEMRAVLAALDSDEFAQQHSVMTLAFYGLRRSEISGLRWDDINLESSNLWVRRSAWNGKANDAAKNTKSVGEVTLGSNAVKSLARWQRLSVSQKGFVFENANGNPLELGTYGYRSLAPLFKHLGLEWKAFNSGRRGVETELGRYTNGNSQITSHHLRHSKEVADRKYFKPLPDETKKAVLAFDASLADVSRQQVQ